MIALLFVGAALLLLGLATVICPGWWRNPATMARPAMSKGARLRAERARTRNPLNTPYAFPRPGEQIDIAVLPGATINTPEAIASMQKQLHDALIRTTGASRRGGIRWHHIHGRDDALAWMAKYETDYEGALTGGELRQAGDQYRAFIDEYGDESVLVVATCEAVNPR